MYSRSVQCSHCQALAVLMAMTNGHTQFCTSPPDITALESPPNIQQKPLVTLTASCTQHFVQM